MAKRFTDTNKYKKKFMRGLQGPYKLLWDYLYHDCDHAGIWIADFEIAQIYLGKDMPVSKNDALTYFNKNEPKVIEISSGEKWFIPSFVEFQYGVLNPKNKAHNSVINILEKYDLINNSLIKIKGLKRGIEGDKDKEKDKDKDKDNIKRYNENIPNDVLEFLKDGSIQPQEFFKNYPCSELDDDANEIVKKILTTKNPNTALEPDNYQLSVIKKFLLLNINGKDTLLKSIEGAEAGDRAKGKPFEVLNLTVDYITNPRNQSRLIGFSDIKTAKNEDQYPTETDQERKIRESKENEDFKILSAKERVNFLIKGNLFAMVSQLKDTIPESNIDELFEKLLDQASLSDDLETCALSIGQTVNEYYQNMGSNQ